MTSEFTESDLDRMLGIDTGPPSAPAEILTESDAYRALGLPDESDTALVREAVRSAAPGERAEALLDISLDDGATDAERAEAQRQLEEAATHPWRVEWPASERVSRRGEEERLAALYRERLGESVTEAKAHVHRELSGAWLGASGALRQLDAVAGVLASERARMERKPNLAGLAQRNAARPGLTETARLANGRTVTITETTRGRS